MSNKFTISKILISFIIATRVFKIDSFKEPEKPIEIEELNYLTDKIIEKDPNQLYVYLDKEVIDCFNKLNLENKLDIIESISEPVKSYKVANYNFTLDALNTAIEACKELNDLDSLTILENYKIKLETGQTLIITEELTKSKNIKYYCNIKVKNKLNTKSLYVRKNSKICGNLSIKGNLKVDENAIFSKDLTAADISTANLKVNENAIFSKNVTAFDISTENLKVDGNAIFLNSITVSDISTESITIDKNPVIVSALSTITNYGFLNGQATLSFPENFVISNPSLTGTFNVTPRETYITITNKGTLTGYNLTDDDPLIQLLNSLEFQCGIDHFSINPLADKLFLYALNLSFNVEIRNTSFDKSGAPKINITLENLPASSNPALFQLDPLTAEYFEDDLFLNESDSQACHSCSNIYICQSLDLDNITRAFTKKLATIKAVIPSVNNISVNSRGTLSFTVNISVLAQDTESTLSTSLPALSLLISQFFQNSSVVFTATGTVIPA